MSLAGHTLLAELGKKRLRPGGKKATNWLLDKTELNHQKMLEVACNMGTTSIELALKHDVAIDAIDLDPIALTKAAQSAKNSKVDHKINFLQANALKLPFELETYDVVLNEAMLTMLSHTNKDKAIQNYYDVLKPGGMLLTHDVCLLTDDITLQKEIIKELSRAIQVHVEPKTVSEWEKTFHQFSNVSSYHGHMTLMNPKGMIDDEGLLNTLSIVRKGLFGKHRKQFMQMFKIFKKYKKHLGFIAVCSVK